jgi:hypothetical protein
MCAILRAIWIKEIQMKKMMVLVAATVYEWAEVVMHTVPL